MSAFHEVTLAFWIVCIACGFLLRENWRARKTIRRLREELDLVWHEYEVACGTVPE